MSTLKADTLQDTSGNEFYQASQSILKVDTLQDTSGNEFYQARVWNVWNQVGTQAITASGNVSSITDNAIAETTTTFANSLSSANYAVACGAGESSSDPHRKIGVYNTMTTSTVRTDTVYRGNESNDSEYNSITITL